jgi:hypothetical protein
MEERKWLFEALSNVGTQQKHEAADRLIVRLRVNNVSRDTLDALDSLLRQDVWKSQKDEGIREKLQTIAIVVDMLILQNPRPFERRTHPKPLKRFVSQSLPRDRVGLRYRSG